MIEHGPCPFQWGDRIDHKLFGLGTVNGEPVAVVGADANSHTTVPKGWIVPVDWDDPKRTATKVGSFALRLVTRPDAKGGAFWSSEFKKLLQVVKAARIASDNAFETAFRPHDGDGLATINRRLVEEQKAVDELLDFLEKDASGEHH